MYSLVGYRPQSAYNAFDRKRRAGCFINDVINDKSIHFFVTKIACSCFARNDYPLTISSPMHASLNLNEPGFCGKAGGDRYGSTTGYRVRVLGNSPAKYIDIDIVMHQCSIGFVLWSVLSWSKTGKAWTGRPGNGGLWRITLLANIGLFSQVSCP